MADIELVIKIPEEIRIAISRMGLLRISDEMQKKVDRAIQRGTPLPKGHGDLKDADMMINKLCTHEASEFFGSVTCAEILDFINNAEPVIEADKAGRER